jgi:hypothetical protein
VKTVLTEKLKGLKVAFHGKFGHPPRGRFANTEAWLEKQLSPEVIAPPYTAPEGELPYTGVGEGGAPKKVGPMDPEIAALKVAYKNKFTTAPRGRRANDKEWLRGELAKPSNASGAAGGAGAGLGMAGMGGWGEGGWGQGGWGGGGTIMFEYYDAAAAANGAGGGAGSADGGDGMGSADVIGEEGVGMGGGVLGVHGRSSEHGEQQEGGSSSGGVDFTDADPEDPEDPDAQQAGKRQHLQQRQQHARPALSAIQVLRGFMEATLTSV